MTEEQTPTEPTEVRRPPAEPVQAPPPGFYPDPKDPSRELYWDGDKWTSEPVESAPLPGFYADPNDPNVDRYWDGRRWTESRQPRTATGPSAPASGEKEQNASGVIIAGYIFAVLMPLVGFIIGLTQINRNRHGLWVVVASVVAFVIWLAIFSGNQSNDFGN